VNSRGVADPSQAQDDITSLRVTIARALFIGFSLISVAFYVVRFWGVFAAGELFHRLGFDWSLFYAQAMAVRAGAGANMYEPAEIDLYLQPLMRYYGGPAIALTGWPQPYPPWLAAMLVPFTLPPAPIGFGLWLGVSVLAALFLGYRVWQFLPDMGPIGAAAAVLAAVPVAWGLFLGQPTVLLAIPVGEMLVSFKAHKDLRAGLWLAVLLLKPQYALLFGVWILWKQRWYALAGAVVGGLAFVLIGVVAAGVPALLRFPAAMGELSDLKNAIAGPTLMMNWRALVLAARPGIDEQLGLILVWALSLLTMLAGLLVWRGKWDPDAPSCRARFCALTLGALLGSYHNHFHGAVLLVVPVAAAWASPTVKSTTRLALWAAIYIPTFFVLWVAGVVDRLAVSPDANVPLWTVWPNVLPAVLFLLAFALLCIDLSGVRVPVHWRPATRRYA
jgi:hypothetical protein